MRSVAAALVLSLAVLAACSSEDDGSPGEEGSSGSSPTGQSPSESSRQSPSDVLTATSRSEEHTSELQSLMRISYAVFCLKKKNIKTLKLIKQELNKTHN